mmetsp:Transcript_83867/g.195101  ORF Transcript_83867/g.195101 Transcript_83867/m.195101 type:complete len:251 (-) Transcript_83867:643-1395(-)
MLRTLCSSTRLPLAHSSFSRRTWSSLRCRTPVICECCAASWETWSKADSSGGLCGLCTPAVTLPPPPPWLLHVEGTALLGVPVIPDTASATSCTSAASVISSLRPLPGVIGRSSVDAHTVGAQAAGEQAMGERSPTAPLATIEAGSLACCSGSSPAAPSAGALPVTNGALLAGRPWHPPVTSRLWRSATQMPSCAPSPVTARSFSSGKHNLMSWRPLQSTSMQSSGMERLSTPKIRSESLEALRTACCST